MDIRKVTGYPWELYESTVQTTQLARLYDELSGSVIADYDGDASWVGGTVADVKRLVREGDPNAIKRAQELAGKLDRDVKVATTGRYYGPSVAGGAVVVPAALAGDPRAFRREVNVLDSVRSPVRIWADIFASCGYSASDVERRGLAILAFAKALSIRRPVELWGYLFTQAHAKSERRALLKIPLGLQPVNWLMGAVVLGSPAFMRSCAFRLVTHIVGKSDVSTIVNPRLSGFHRELVTQNPNDIVLEGAIWDRDDLRDPIKWVHVQLDKMDSK